MKKAQVQMAESIMTIIILLIILSVGFIFYGRVKEANIGQTQLEYQDLDLVGLSQIVFSLPELQCSFATVKDVGCIDELKFNGTKKLINSDTPEGKQANAYYQSLFGRTKITLLKLHYDKPFDEKNIPDGTYPDLSSDPSDEDVDINIQNPRHIYLYDFSIDNFQSKNTIYMPTIVYNPLNQKQYFGWLQIESFN